MQRDEAEAQAREDEQERRTQLVDSERRLQLLRGHPVDDLPANEEQSSTVSLKNHRGHGSKRRRIAGEDDTERDMRLAKEDAALQSRGLYSLRPTNQPLTDTKGHISLFQPKCEMKEKNKEAEAEQAKKKREHEDQYTMRFSNAAGFKQGLNDPWYSTISRDDPEEVPSKDVWGNEDVGRREREKMRADVNDPLSKMRKGVKKLRDVEKSRGEWRAERERELQELKALGQSRRKVERDRKRRRERIDSDSLEDFSLEASTRDRERKGQYHKPRRHRHHRDSRSGG